MNASTVAVVTVTLNKGGSYTVQAGDIDIVLDEIRDTIRSEGEIGDEFTIRHHEMPVDEYEALPEFDGW